ncbi:MAG: [protein-PII] uridylyltransferase [Deltaproteobacteria bacterium]|nr:[protein-PII] uridylyltransferase [Deltaproteobacteria bacterium]
MNAAFEELKTSRDTLVSRFASRELAAAFTDEYTRLMDQYFRRSLEDSEAGRTLFRKKKPFAFVAVGGYGRKELCLHSDIDMFILFGGQIPPQAKELAHEIFLPLWDLGLDLGYGVRNIKDCLRLAKNDFEVLTSLMDMRFICGDSPLYLSLAEPFHSRVLEKKPRAFTHWLLDRYGARMTQFGDASYQLEPNLKDGIGGLRDYHHMLWLSGALFQSQVPEDLEYLGKLSHDEYQDLRQALEFILLTRNRLHDLSGRRNDRLGFDYQEKIAEAIGFEDGDGLMAVEHFLGKLHACMATLKTLYHSFVNTYVPGKRYGKKESQPEKIADGLLLHKGSIYFETATGILKAPMLLAKIFEKSVAMGRPLSLEARRLVKEFAFLVDTEFKRSPEAVQLLLDVLNAKKNAGVLDEMFETGYLNSFIPEFGAVMDRVQFDAYHTYPVGRHSLETLKNLRRLAGQPDLILRDIFSELKDPEPLLLAALLHDIGKVGEGHARRGVEIARRILDRFAYDDKKAEDVLFLVGHHLLLAETATRRDLNDEKLVVQVARLIGNEKRLKMLYLLTWADSNATGPRAWNGWIANLVQELFFKALHILQGKELATLDASQKAETTKFLLRSAMSGRMDKGKLEIAIDMMPPRYLLNTPGSDIVRHLEWLEPLGEKLKSGERTAFHLAAEEDEAEGCWKLTFIANDRPGLFSDLAGVLSLNNINVLSADIYTWRDGTALDVFRVTAPLDPIHPDETWDRVKNDLRNTFGGKLSLAYRLGEKSAPAFSLEASRPLRPPRVVVDNTSSDFFTVIEVFANDRIGLLYDITRTLFDLRLDIRISKISTKVDQSADVFYVRDLDGQKLEDDTRASELRAALIHQLSR